MPVVVVLNVDFVVVVVGIIELVVVVPACKPNVHALRERVYVLLGHLHMFYSGFGCLSVCLPVSVFII